MAIHSNNKTTLIVYIGCFAGMGDIQTGLKFSDQHDIVFISINYRIGPFGRHKIYQVTHLFQKYIAKLFTGGE